VKNPQIRSHGSTDLALLPFVDTFIIDYTFDSSIRRRSFRAYRSLRTIIWVLDYLESCDSGHGLWATRTRLGWDGGPTLFSAGKSRIHAPWELSRESLRRTCTWSRSWWERAVLPSIATNVVYVRAKKSTTVTETLSEAPTD
jgi:hypothetical protein